MSHHGGGGREGGGGRHGDYDRRGSDRPAGRGGNDRFNDRGPHYRGRDGGGRGRGGGGGWQGHGGGGSRGESRGGDGRSESYWRPIWENEGLAVQANLFKLRFEVQRATWYQYQIQINNVKKVPKKDDEGNVMKEDGKTQFDFVVGRGLFDDRELSHDNEAETTKQEKRNRASHLSRRIIGVFQKGIRVSLINDGSSMAISPRQVEGLSTSADERLKRKKKDAAPAGIYGPADQGGSAAAPEQIPIIKPWKVYPPIQVRRDCDDDDPEAHLSPVGWYQIKLTEVGSFSFQVDRDGGIRGTDKAPEACCQAINLAVKNAMLGRMLALDRDSRCFYFKQDPYQNIPMLNINYNNACMPLYGLLQTAKLTANGVCIMADLGLGWQRLDKDQHNNPIRVLEPDRNRGGKLAGVHISDLNSPIPETLREEVQRALKKITFHVKYSSPDSWVEEKSRKPLKGFDDGDIEGKRKHWKKRAKMGKRNQRLFKVFKSSDETNIKWSADDPNELSFDFAFFSPEGVKEGTQRITVAEYYRRRYHIILKYPKMPLVRISQQEWFPVEFLFVSHGSAAGGANEFERNSLAERKTTFALKFNDNFACKDRIREISKLIASEDVYRELTSKLELLNLKLDTEPMKLKSKVLKMPRLVDGTEREIGIQNGSWNLRDGTTFKKPATMHSFGVLNLAGPVAESHRDLSNEIFNALARHGVNLAFVKGPEDRVGNVASKFWHQVMYSPPSSHADNPVRLRQAFGEAKTRARNLFMRNVLALNLCFRTLARVKEDQDLNAKEVVVFPWNLVSNQHIDQQDSRYTVMDFTYYSDERIPTHIVTLPGGSRQLDAFLMYRITLDDQNIVELVPNDVRLVGSIIEVLHPQDGWIYIRNQRLEPIFWVADSGVAQKYWLPHHLVSYELTGMFQIVDEDDIECPSLVYVLLAEKTKDLYYWTKWDAYLGVRGINTQTIVLASFGRQRNQQKMQFCSNIALKTNTKLATSQDKACAWSWSDKYSNGTNDIERMWLTEVPTLIVSLSMALAQGQENKMVVVGTGYLDVEGQTCCYEARAQPKSSLIDCDVVKSIFMHLIWSYVRYTGYPPDRIIVIRSSAHEGLFRDVLDKEVAAVREGFLEARPPGLGSCERCGVKGCHRCCPLITCLVAQSAHHNIRLVPDDNSVEAIGGRNPNKNVPSGTCVDSSELLLPVNAEALDLENQHLQSGKNDPENLMLFGGTGTGRSDFFLVPHGGLKGTSNGVLYRMVLNENAIFGRSGTTKLTGDKLQRLIYALSFVYGKATKAPRDTALVRTGALLAQNLLGIISSMNREEQHNFLVEFNTPSGSTIFKTRFGDSLMPSFGPFRGGVKCEPFRPHVLA